MKHPVRRRVVAYGILAVVLGGTWRLRSSLFNLYRGRGWNWPKSLARVLKEHEPRVRAAYEPLCAAVGIQWPPRRIHFVAFKQELLLETWVANAEGRLARIATHPIQGSSGKLGPKTVAGDFQVPEGIYRISKLNPDSAFHLSLRVDYPNADEEEAVVKSTTVTQAGEPQMVISKEQLIQLQHVFAEQRAPEAQDLLVAAVAAGFGQNVENVIALL